MGPPRYNIFPELVQGKQGNQIETKKGIWPTNDKHPLFWLENHGFRQISRKPINEWCKWGTPVPYQFIKCVCLFLKRSFYWMGNRRMVILWTDKPVGPWGAYFQSQMPISDRFLPYKYEPFGSFPPSPNMDLSILMFRKTKIRTLSKNHWKSIESWNVSFILLGAQLMLSIGPTSGYLT